MPVITHYLSSRFGTRNGWILWRVSSNVLAKALVQRPHGEQRPQGHGQKKARTHTLDSSNKRSWVGSTLMICKIGFSRLHTVLCLSLGLKYGPTNCELLPLACRTQKPSHFSLVLPPFPRIKAASSSVILRVSTCWMATLRYSPGLCLGSRRPMGENGTTEIESNDYILIVALYPFLWL